MYPRWTAVLLPYTRFELPAWGKLLKLAKVAVPFEDQRWTDAPRKKVRGKLHGYLMYLDLSNWSERYTYFLGRYYELQVQLALMRILNRGDRFVDVGANIGMITLLAAHLVGENGQVDSFEPNPECVKRIVDSLRCNSISNVTVYPVGLSDANGSLQLYLTSSHSGTATMAAVDGATKSYDVDVLIGDDVVLKNPQPVKLMKIDVEGFELHVLKGLTRTLEMHHPVLITEFVESHFLRAGTSCLEIYNFLTGLGYKAYELAAQRKWLRYQLQFNPLKASHSSDARDILWVHASVGTRGLFRH